mmetsp:Transcript_24759/g.49367  ORF Transcript_24759/g.49367 Transcript_24759/m.49367 type:complete len:163 (-) Transcript_24759:396-884(-)|eukprot:CAMPEP_0171334656 /NCGR_PEP_ID=MMETSP0878-20121228/4808_1 /TAXON_ID=67004 /ORGANISM="Thalassiosira weissflogii, Strain CCMP1336" /LENGTH=162 /DNA_ID=CAMNT_0011835785 /DNA_START=75 /DNA_END=563 /DNA_ORIENTATION=-
MRTSKQMQREARRRLDEKLDMARPSNDLLEELATNCTTSPSPDNTFQYAFALSKSQNNADELNYSISLLSSLIKDGYAHQLDCMYGIATARYLLGQYDKARMECEAILRSRPEHELAGELHLACLVAKEEREEEKVKKVVVGGTVAVAAVGLAMLLGGGKRR